MNDAAARDLLERYWRLVAERATDAIGDLVTEEFVEEWPQSGERLRGADAWRAVVEGHPTYPAVALRRIIGCGNVWACEADFAYPGGNEPWRVCAIVELRSGRIDTITQYFGAPFEAASWRERFVERTSRLP